MIEHSVLIIVDSYGYNEDCVGVFVADVQTIESRHIQACEVDARTTESRQIEAGGANMCVSKLSGLQQMCVSVLNVNEESHVVQTAQRVYRSLTIIH
jgi:hypothetical protein